MFSKALVVVLRKLSRAALLLAVILLIGRMVTDTKVYPGMEAFDKANALITTSVDGSFHGDTDETRHAASLFAAQMASSQKKLFEGGSGNSFATGGSFVTYVKRTESAVVILCHVPQLRNYKSPEVRQSLAALAWNTGKQAAKRIPDVRPTDRLIIGLRGFGSYGPIWEGSISGDATVKSDEINDRKRLYPFFVDPNRDTEKASPQVHPQ